MPETMTRRAELRGTPAAVAAAVIAGPATAPADGDVRLMDLARRIDVAEAAFKVAVVAADEAAAAARSAMPRKPLAAMGVRVTQRAGEPVRTHHAEASRSLRAWEAACADVRKAHRVEELDGAAWHAEDLVEQLGGQLAEVPAASIAGLAVKLRYLARIEALDVVHDPLLASAAADAERLAGARAA